MEFFFFEHILLILLKHFQNSWTQIKILFPTRLWMTMSTDYFHSFDVSKFASMCFNRTNSFIVGRSWTYPVVNVFGGTNFGKKIFIMNQFRLSSFWQRKHRFFVVSYKNKLNFQGKSIKIMNEIYRTKKQVNKFKTLY